MNDGRIREFLTDSLALWGVAGAVDIGKAPIVAVIRAADGTIVSVERNAGGPFRWVVRSPRPRPCTSIAGVLNALRSALGVERGEPIRVTPAPR